jgi:hypothetical protein
MTLSLRRFWFEFEADPTGLPLGMSYGCGVTARDYDDALALLRERAFPGGVIPRFLRSVEDVDVSTLDPRHVLPNMHPPVVRGIWFPMGY